MTQAFFDLVAAVVIVGALGVVMARSTVYAALFLIASLLGVAGVYVLLATEFLALVQLLIYGGAVTVLLLFALMLTHVRDLRERAPEPAQRLGALLAGGGLLAGFITMVYRTRWPRDNGTITSIDFNTIGNALFNRWAVPFEIASGVLLVALVGAVVIAMQEEGEHL
ncbi:MAG: NADH-quinone oxidoreductase subunit J [Dehalococcoidia bacterium]|nr:NADH-quinone oxidoreductase subunit J [Dehalococcoidia bacterium]